MELEDYLPFWEKLSGAQQNMLKENVWFRTAEPGTVLHNGSADCIGLIVLKSGQIRSYMLSEDGREITVFRLLEGDICLFSASCMMQSIQFDVTVSVEKAASFWIIPPNIYRKLMEESAAVANYTNELMAARFSEVMWLVEQILWKSLDKRLAGFLVEESHLDGGTELKLTHEQIANHLGTAREVVTRMLRYFRNEGWVKISRGTITLLKPEELERLSESI